MTDAPWAFNVDHPSIKPQQVFSTENLPPEADFGEFRKKVPTRATRIEGPFMVLTSEGPLTCADGWLCIDARGYPYPVAADEFDLIYGDA
jgi:hypothetical protein